MNSNTPLEASNLDNPSHLLHHILHGVNSSNKSEIRYTENLKPAVLALRTAASHCMCMQDKEDHESYDFKLSLS